MNQPRTGATSRALRSATLRFAMAWALLLPFASEIFAQTSPSDATLARTKKDARANTVFQMKRFSLIPGNSLGGGMYSLAKARRVMPLKEGTYEKGAIYVKTRELFVMGKGAKTFQSSVLMSALEGVNVREIRPVSTPHNSGAMLTSDTYGIGRLYAVRFEPGVDVQKLCNDLAKNPEVEYAEPIYVYQQMQDRVTPTDPLFTKQYHWARIEAEKAWGISTGSEKTIIAICDSGVDIEHEDLKDNIWTNPGESGMDAMGRDKRTNGVDDDNNGKVDDWRGWDFIGNTTAADRAASILRPDNDPRPRPFRDLDTEDGLNHGSHVAGIAGATANNNKGGLGSGFRCRILPIKQATEDAANSTSVILGYEGILYAAQMGAHIVNCSWGGANGFSQAQQDIINTATALGTLVVAAAGNSGVLMDDDFVPASFDNVMSVGSSDENDVPSGFSNFGIKTSVFAPGSNILSTVIGSRYTTYNGTSMASPLAAGVAALVRTLHPEWTPQQVTQQIRGTSDNVLVPGASVRPSFYFGRMNAYRALSINRTLNGDGDLLPGIVGAGNSLDAVNGLLTSFEPKRFVLAVKNILSNATDVSVTLTPIDPTITALQPTVSIGNLATGQRKDAEFTIQLQPGATASAGAVDVADFLVTYRSGSYTNYERVSIFFQLAAGSTPQLAVSPTLDFGTTPVPTTATVSIKNIGNQNVRVTAATQDFTGTNASEFKLVTPLDGTTLEPGASVTRQVRFTPTAGATGQRTANFNLVGMSDGVVPTSGAGTPIANGYRFSTKRETYTEITDNNFPFANAGAGLDDDEKDITLPFPFQFGPTTYTNVRLVSNGFLAFAPARSSITETDFVRSPIGDGTFGADGIIAGFALDLFMLGDGTIRYTTQGDAPNRVFIVQWKRASFVGSTNGASPDADLNFQIRLYEGSNRIELAYDKMSYTLEGFLIRGQVGLRGKNTSDFNSRLVNFQLNDWLTSSPATASTDRCDLFPDIAPPSGLVYVYTPGDFAALNTPRIVSFQRTTQLTATARSGGVLWTDPPLATGLDFNTTIRIGGTVVSVQPVTVGTIKTLTVTLANISANPLTITDLNIVPSVDGTSGEFRVLTQTPITIPANGTSAVQVAFSPSLPRARDAALRITYDGVTAVMPLTGEGQRPTNLLRYYNDVGTDLTGTAGFFSRFDRLPPFSLTGTLPPLSLVPIGTTRVVNLVSLRNMGTEPITVTRSAFLQATLNTVQSTEFSLLTPLPFTVQPGAQQQLSIAYSPTQAGEKLVDIIMFSDKADSARLRVGSVGGIPRAVQVTARATADVINSTPSMYQFNFGLVNVNTTATQRITLRNSSTASMSISRIDLGGLNGSDFTVSTAFPIRLAANESLALTVSFRPKDVGVRIGTMTVAYDQAPGSETVLLLGSGNALRRLAVPLSTVFFATTAPNATSSTIGLGIRGAGRDTVTVTSVSIEGKNASEFRLLREIPVGTKIAPNATSTATVFFAPTSNGQKEARLVVRSNAEFPVMTVDLRASAEASAARATLATVDATAQIGDDITVPIILRGVRNLPANTTIYANLRLNATVLQPLDAASTGTVYDNQRLVRLTFTPNGTDTVMARLRYRVLLGNDTTTVLRLEDAFATNANISAVSGKLGILGAPQAFLQVASGQSSAVYSAQQGETVSMPIVVRNRHRIPAGRFLFASMSYNATLLEPTNLTSLAAGNTVASAVRTVVFAIPAGSAADTVITPTFRAAIGSATGSTVTMLNTVKLTDPTAGDLILLQPSGSFLLTKFNQAGGQQLFFSPKAALVIVQSSPNPATDAITVSFRKADEGDVTMTLSDISGKTVREELLSSIKAGEHTVRLATTTLPSGSYLLTLRSGEGKVTRTVQIVR